MNKLIFDNWKTSSLLVIIFIFSLLQGIKGIDFGYHWDEHRITNSIKRSATDGLLLPRWYHYPSASFDLALLGTIPEFFKNESYDFSNIQDSRSDKNNIKFRIRSIFLFFTLFSSIIIFLLIRLWRNNYFEAFIGSAILLSSWELHYHARWIAPDGLMMTFGILSMLIMFVSIKSKNLSTTLLRIAAIFVGLTCSTKYPGGIFLLPLFYSAYLNYIKNNFNIILLVREYFYLLLIFIMSFIIFTPGMVLEPLKFIHDVTTEIRHYKNGGHGGYDVTSIYQHFLLMYKYIAFVVFSKYAVIAYTLFLFFCIGSINLIKNNTKMAIWFLLVPILYFLYFSTQKVMLVRNLLVLFPFLSLLTSRGIITLVNYLKNGYLKKIVLLCISVFLLINFLWIKNTANSIQQKNILNNYENILSYINNNPNTHYYLTDSITKYFLIDERYTPINIVNQLDQADKIIFLSNEITDSKLWIINRPGVYEIVSGIFEVNWNYYASWRGDTHILAVDKEIAQKLRISS